MLGTQVLHSALTNSPLVYYIMYITVSEWLKHMNGTNFHMLAILNNGILEGWPEVATCTVGRYE